MSELTLYQMTEATARLADLMMHAEEQTELEEIGECIDQLLDRLIPDKVEAYCRLMASLQAAADAIGLEEKRLAARRRTLERQTETLRNRLHCALDLAGIAKLQAHTFTVSLQRNPPSTEIYDAAQLPELFMVPQPPVANRPAILDALKRGAEVPGARLITDRTHLRIR
jgi:hypothetical protein